MVTVEETTIFRHDDAEFIRHDTEIGKNVIDAATAVGEAGDQENDVGDDKRQPAEAATAAATGPVDVEVATDERPEEPPTSTSSMDGGAATESIGVSSDT